MNKKNGTLATYIIIAASALFTVVLLESLKTLTIERFALLAAFLLIIGLAVLR